MVELEDPEEDKLADKLFPEREWAEKAKRGARKSRYTANQIQIMHDKYHPDIIFLPDTSAHLKGYVIREAWKTAWPNETPPKMLRINVKAIKRGSVQLAESAYKDLVRQTKAKLTKFGKTGNIMVVDCGGIAEGSKMEGPGIFELPKGYDPIKEKKQNDYVGILRSALSVVRDSANELGLQSRVIGVAMNKEVEVRSPFYSTSGETHLIKRYSGTRTIEGERKGYKIARDGIEPEEKRGRLYGGLIAKDEQKRKGLEQKVAAFIAVGGLVLSSILSTYSLTGNVIGINRTTNWLGILFFFLGIIGSLLYLKRK